MSLARVFKALSEEPRLQILALLREQELSGAELMSALRISQSRVSRHLGVLREAGLVEARRDGSWVYFKAAAEDAATAEALESVGGLLETVVDARIRARLQTALLKRRTSVRSFFAEKAAEWDQLRGDLSDELSVLKMLAPLLPVGLRVADLGTGTGALLPHLARYGARVFAIDSSAPMLAEARARMDERAAGQVVLLQAELEALPLANGGLDVSVCHMVLHYSAQPELIVNEMGRVVTDGGLLAIVDLAPHDHEELREKLAHQRLGFSREEIGDWFEKSGAELLSYELAPMRLGEQGLTVFYAIGRKKKELP